MELPRLEPLGQKYKDKGLNVVRRLFGVRSFPTSYLIDREGRIMYSHLGFEEGDEKNLEQEVFALR